MKILKFITIAIVYLYVLCSAKLMAASNVDAQILNWDGTFAGVLQFAGVGNATIDEPWIHSPQYLRVLYNSDEAIWGVRIVTDNNLNMDPDHKGLVYPKPQNKGPDNQWEWELHPEWGGKYKYENGQWLTGDDSVSFGGLINPATKHNPNYRADIAWQVFRDPVPEPDPIYKNWQGIWNVGGNWNDDWAYVVDKSNRWNGELVVGGVFYPSPPAPPWSQKYEMIVTGNPVVNYLAQHPVVSGSKQNPDPKPGDCDIAVYIAACFGIMENGKYVGILPMGNYTTRLYLEIIHE